MKMRALVAVFVFVLASACGPPAKITGTVDGDEVPTLVDGAFAIVEDEDNDVNVTFAIFTTYPNACELLGSQFKLLSEAFDPKATANDLEDSVDDLASHVGDNELVGHWTIEVVGFAEKEADFRGGNELDIDKDEGDRSDFAVQFQEGEPELEDGALDQKTDRFVADDGSMTWTLDEELRNVAVLGTAKLRDEDGDKSGDVEFEGKANFCQPLSDSLVDLLDNLNANSCRFARDGTCDESTGDCAAGTDETDCD